MKPKILPGPALSGLVLVTGGLMLCGCSDRGANSDPAGRHTVPTYRVDEAWPDIPKGWVFGQVSGVDVDSNDHVWVLHRPRTVPAEIAHRAAPAVVVFDTNGNLVRSWGGPGEGYEWPDTEHGIFVDHNEYVWIVGNGAGDAQVLKFTEAGEFVMQIGRAGQSGGNADTKNLDRPAAVYVYPSTNELFVADGYGNRRIIVFDAQTGEFKRMWGAFGNPPTDPEPRTDAQLDGQTYAGSEDPDPPHFNIPHGVQVSADGLVYVSDRGSMRFQVFTMHGDFVTQVFLGRREPDPQELRARAAELAFDDPVTDLIEDLVLTGHSALATTLSPDPEQRYLFVADRSNQQVVVFNRRTLEPLTEFGRTGDQPGEFYILHDMAMDSQGNLYTAEVNQGSRVQKFVPTRPVPDAMVSPVILSANRRIRRSATGGGRAEKGAAIDRR